VIKQLLAKGANVNAKTIEQPGARRGPGGFRGPAAGQTPLFVAARAGHIEAMKALLDAGADPKAKSADGGSLLMAAVGSARVEVVKFAYNFDNDARIVTNSGSTLMHASVSGTANGATQEAQDRVCDVIRFLADKGAPLDEKNAAGRTPIDLADGLPIDKAVDLFTELIIKSGSKPKSPSKR
jgi:ankyrin repeat protein